MITYNNPKDTERRSNVGPLSLEEMQNTVNLLNTLVVHADKYGSMHLLDEERAWLQNLIDSYSSLRHFYDNAGGWEGLAKIQKDNEELKGKIAELFLAIDPIDKLAGYHKMTEILYGTIEAKPLNISPNNKWISVDERLPEDEQDCIIYTGTQMFDGAIYWQSDKVWHVSEVGDLSTTEVTHWQPLPSPPTE